MLRVEKGGEYTASRVRNGQTEKGEWELIVIKEESRAHREIVLFAHNAPSGVQEGGRFRVNEILATGPRRSKNADGSWSTYEKTSVEAVVEPVGGEDILGGDGFDDLDGLL